MYVLTLKSEDISQCETRVSPKLLNYLQPAGQRYILSHDIIIGRVSDTIPTLKRNEATKIPCHVKIIGASGRMLLPENFSGFDAAPGA
jgi:hypothetical protein